MKTLNTSTATDAKALMIKYKSPLRDGTLIELLAHDLHTYRLITKEYQSKGLNRKSLRKKPVGDIEDSFFLEYVPGIPIRKSDWFAKGPARWIIGYQIETGKAYFLYPNSYYDDVYLEEMQAKGWRFMDM